MAPCVFGLLLFGKTPSNQRALQICFDGSLFAPPVVQGLPLVELFASEYISHDLNNYSVLCLKLATRQVSKNHINIMDELKCTWTHTYVGGASEQQ